MDSLLTQEKQLLADIDRCREQFPRTPDLYREVCVLLFFRYGVTPTANKLYQLVRKGSMSAPAEALNKFWDDLREKSRVRIEHPDLPEALKTAAGELTAALWSAAQQAAIESLAAYRNEAQASVIEATTTLAATEAKRAAEHQALEQAQQLLDQAQERIRTLEWQLAASDATAAALTAQLQQVKAECGIHQQHLEDARHDFAAELDKLRAVAELADERAHAAEKRALLEIDRERVAAAKLQKELDAARNTAIHADERHRKELATLQAQLGDLREKIGSLEGNQQAVNASRDQAAGEIKSLQVQLAEMTVHLSTARTEIDTWRKKAAHADELVKERRAIAKPARPARKAKME